jgi:hypothetical protein
VGKGGERRELVVVCTCEIANIPASKPGFLKQLCVAVDKGSPYID